MKSGSPCPSCQGLVFFYVRRAAIPDHRYSNSDSFRDLTLTGIDTKRAVGLEAWICRACGHTQLYTRDLPLLEEMAQSRAGVVIVDRTQTD